MADPSTGVIETDLRDARWAAALENAPNLAQACADQLGKIADRPLGDATVVLADDGLLRDLNHRFRRKNSPTNVLAFPDGDAASGRRYAGDVVLSYDRCAEEARAAGRSFADHAAHLMVHGLAHLMGFDHVEDADAVVMERLEAKVLARLGVPDPYDDGH